MNIRKDYPEISTVLMNYVAPEKGPRVPCICMFNELISTMPYPEYMEILRKVLINVDVTFDYTYGRGIVEAAALKIPTVGSSTIEAQRVMLPELAITPGKDDEMEAAIEDLLLSDDMREEMAQQAYENCEIYSLKSSYDLMTRILNEECK
jgi:glycosyltransferase involved in cell wall biosynthesis